MQVLSPSCRSPSSRCNEGWISYRQVQEQPPLRSTHCIGNFHRASLQSVTFSQIDQLISHHYQQNSVEMANATVETVKEWVIWPFLLAASLARKFTAWGRRHPKLLTALLSWLFLYIALNFPGWLPAPVRGHVLHLISLAGSTLFGGSKLQVVGEQQASAPFWRGMVHLDTSPLPLPPERRQMVGAGCGCSNSKNSPGTAAQEGQGQLGACPAGTQR